ncbi:MAG: hypothetical protein HYX73_11315 [Acidobacteria bacterium]|nr:hypothetical protein [Acidobacteriota bacterium]
MSAIRFVLAVIFVTLLGSNLLFAQNTAMSFFVTSSGPGKGGNLGGLAGADRHCQTLAAAAGAGSRTWRAYLSANDFGGQAAVNARDRIGQGPWYNAKGVRIAESVANLHSDNNNLNRQTALDEKGQPVNGRGDSPNRHDILTGSQLDGTAYADGLTCNNWTSSDAGTAQIGHHDRESRTPGISPWNSAHETAGCSQEALRSTGGDGLFYCFAVD